MKLQNFFKLLFFLLFFLLSLNSVAKESTEDRVKKLTLELRCMTCQNQSVSDSDSDFAKDISKIVEEKFKDGLSEKEIKIFLTDRYGEYILLKPYFNSKNLLLWLFPFVLVIASMFVFFKKIKKK
ncbi:MAG: cytochrome c-type biogenesis protein CcmH [Pelagibacteraceae bacterium]|jgi:cytochrome c-type biogenesis protein CcmH|nr:cytochrome c-type biogenesis protein CcmH [Pelagibacteraceae bacterium]MBT3902936.1 cytochrome c-type biogenesis protein CcmH [Pelagibacteraceae bacterium]MBT4646449.1 cytochrome c-type biogenesis protein CcmH [Pelagibacteraceae bacterium]MBT6353473.1 cytochrome c-type biogenesis protein CcmH [Pelagibacteraceae bacterium]